MRCREASEWMSLQLDSLLAEEEAQALRSHLAACAGCRAEWERMLRACELLEDVEFAAPSSALAARVLARIRRRELRSAFLRGGAMSLLGLAVLVAAGIVPLVSTLGMALSNPTTVHALVGFAVHAVDILSTLAGAVELVLDAVFAVPTFLVLVGYVVITGALALAWMRLVSQPMRVARGRAL